MSFVFCLCLSPSRGHHLFQTLNFFFRLFKKTLDSFFNSKVFFPYRHHLYAFPLPCSLVGAISALSLCYTREPVVPEGRFYTHLVPYLYICGPSYAAAIYGTSFDCLALVPSRTFISGFHGTITVGEKVLVRCHAWVLHKHQTETTSSHSVKKKCLFTYPGASV